MDLLISRSFSERRLRQGRRHGIAHPPLQARRGGVRLQLCESEGWILCRICVRGSGACRTDSQRTHDARGGCDPDHAPDGMRCSRSQVEKRWTGSSMPSRNAALSPIQTASSPNRRNAWHPCDPYDAVAGVREFDHLAMAVEAADLKVPIATTFPFGRVIAGAKTGSRGSHTRQNRARDYLKRGSARFP